MITRVIRLTEASAKYLGNLPREDAILVVEVEFDASKPDGTMRKMIDVSKLHRLGWHHKIEIEEGVQKLFDWYKASLN